MMRSMQSAVTGLRAQQTAMDVIGNNIANVNTAGFKASTTTFSDLFYQTLNSGSANVNPSQVGYGAEVSGVSKNMSSVGATTTDNPTDLYISGEGYFAVNTKADGSGQTYFTRVGNFTFKKGYLVDASGNYVMSNQKNAAGNYMPMQIDSNASMKLCIKDANGGYTPITDTDITYTDGGGHSQTIKANFDQLSNITIGQDGSITASLGNTTGTIVVDTSSPAVANPTLPTTTDVEKIGLAEFLNGNGLTQEGGNYYVANEATGAPNYTTAGSNNNTTLQSGELEMSNVDIAKEFTNMITTQRGFQANSRVITVSDSMLEELVNLKRS